MGGEEPLLLCLGFRAGRKIRGFSLLPVRLEEGKSEDKGLVWAQMVTMSLDDGSWRPGDDG